MVSYHQEQSAPVHTSHLIFIRKNFWVGNLVAHLADQPVPVLAVNLTFHRSGCLIWQPCDSSGRAFNGFWPSGANCLCSRCQSYFSVSAAAGLTTLWQSERNGFIGKTSRNRRYGGRFDKECMPNDGKRKKAVQHTTTRLLLFIARSGRPVLLCAL